MSTPFIIDSHEDLAYESLYGKFDYTRSVAENRKNYRGPNDFQCTIGWPECQKGKIGIVFGTIFMEPCSKQDKKINNTGISYAEPDEFHSAACIQLDFYDHLQTEHPDMFRRIMSRTDLDEIVRVWSEKTDSEKPVGIVSLMEGCEALRSFDDLDYYYERGIRLIGPVWAGGRWCAGTKSIEMKDALTEDGKNLLRKMSSLGYILDVSHMKNHSAMDSLDYFDGIAVATHANCAALLNGFPFERHLNDETIRMLAEHGGVMGVIPFNYFLSLKWTDRAKTPRNLVTLDTMANHIDHICQLAGDSRYAAIGTDFDGGFGFPEIPYEMNDISDLPKLADVLERRGYKEDDIANIFHRNWQRILERALK